MPIAALALTSVIDAGVTLRLRARMVPFFSGFELAILKLAIGVWLKRSYMTDRRINIKRMLTVERGRNEPEQTIDIERFYARFLVRHPRSKLDRPEVRLQYRQDGQRFSLRIGKFLNTDETMKLEQALIDVIKRLDV